MKKQLCKHKIWSSFLIFLCILICVFLVSTNAFAGWKFEWQIDPMTDNANCLVFSESHYFKTGYGKNSSRVYIGIQNNGLISIHSDKSPFDHDALGSIGIRVDNNPPVFNPQRGSNVNTLIFPEVKSTQLHAQMATGKSIKLQIVFFPKGQKQSKDYTLNGYVPAMAEYQGCRIIQNHTGWLGIYMFQAQNEEKWMKWLKKKTKYTGPGVMLITVDPRKEAAKKGLQTADVIIGCDQKEATVESLIEGIDSLSPGQSIQLDVVRGQKLLKKTITKPIQ